MIKRISLLAIPLAWLSISGCFIEFGIPGGDNGNWTALNRLDMEDSVATEAQERGMLRPPEGTVATEQFVYPFAKEERSQAGDQLINPLPMNRANLQLGREKYDIYCAVCHGVDGLGPLSKSRGGVTTRAPQLTGASITDERIYGLSKTRPGEIFHVITRGNAIMGSYSSQLEPLERWAVVHWVRTLGRAQNPNPEDG